MWQRRVRFVSRLGGVGSRQTSASAVPTPMAACHRHARSLAALLPWPCQEFRMQVTNRPVLHLTSSFSTRTRKVGEIATLKGRLVKKKYRNGDFFIGCLCLHVDNESERVETEDLDFESDYDEDAHSGDRNEWETIKGNFPRAEEHLENETDLKLVVQWEEHEEYGIQGKILQVSQDDEDDEIPIAEVKYDETGQDWLDVLEAYLTANVKGFGSTNANKFTNHLREDGDLKSLKEFTKRVRVDPGYFCDIPGVGTKMYGALKTAFESKSQRFLEVFQNLVVLLGPHVGDAKDLSGLFSRIMLQERADGEDYCSKIKDNPYCLADIRGVSFNKADRIALSMGVAERSPLRIMAGAVQVLRKETGGSMAVGKTKLADDVFHLLNESHPVSPRNNYAQGSESPTLEFVSEIQKVLSEYDDPRIKMRTIDPSTSKNDDCGNFFLLSKMDTTEEGIARLVRKIRLSKLSTLRLDSRTAIKWAEQRSHFENFADGQVQAVASACTNNISVVVGGPGTGKSTIIQAMVEIFRGKFNQHVIVVAPTGKAAQRLNQLEGVNSASTIHRLLGWYSENSCYKHDEDNPVEVGVVIVDEASMIDTRLFYSLLRAIPSGARVVLTGDVDQLPPVGPGYPLRDIIASGLVPVTRLSVNYRQGGLSDIVKYANKINAGDGELPPVRKAVADLSTHHQVQFLEVDDTKAIPSLVSAVTTDFLGRKLGLDPRMDVQVLSPTKEKGEASCLALNARLSSELRYESAMDEWEGFRQGDKVMHIRNDYDRDIFNGNVGIVEALEKDSTGSTVGLHVKFEDPYGGDKHISYTKSDIDDLILAFAVTVHKSQGSEVRAIILSLADEHNWLLQRNLLYTAVTRAKEMVVIVGETKAYVNAVRKTQSSRRCTTLEARLQNRLR